MKQILEYIKPKTTRSSVQKNVAQSSFKRVSEIIKDAPILLNCVLILYHKKKEGTACCLFRFFLFCIYKKFNDVAVQKGSNKSLEHDEVTELAWPPYDKIISLCDWQSHIFSPRHYFIITSISITSR